MAAYRPAKVWTMLVRRRCSYVRVPAFWACTITRPARKAHGAGYATYAGVWRSRLQLLEGEGAERYCDQDPSKFEPLRDLRDTHFMSASTSAMVNVPCDF